MIALVTGPPGSGKSFYAVRKAVDELEKGKVVVTNVPMVSDWPQRVANRHPLRWLIPGRRKALMRRWARSVHHTDDLRELFAIRLRGHGESRGVAIFDEAHIWMNSRLWRDDDRLSIVNWFSQHRKLGWDVYLITQDAGNIDRQVRSLFEYHVTLRNLRRMKVAGIPVAPINLFLAIWQWHSGAKAIVKREAYTLNWTKGLYDTFGTYEGAEAPPDCALLLPREIAGGLTSASSGSAAAAPCADAPPEEVEPPTAAAVGSSNSQRTAIYGHRGSE